MANSPAVLLPDGPHQPARFRAAATGLMSLLKGPAITVAVVLGFLALWEGYKAFGTLVGDSLPLPVATDDQAMPHVWDVLSALRAPASPVVDTSLLVYYLGETTVTLREAFYGLVIGSAIGLLFAIVLRESRFATRSVLPWMVVSQTVPLVALAPVVVVWTGRAGLPSWVAVTVISAYLSFFPVVVNGLRGLNSPSGVHAELMTSVAADRWTTLRLLRLPAAVPYLFIGLRLAATASVVGAVVGELAAGTGRGIGRSILTASYYFSNAPEKLFAAVLIASLAGIAFVQLIRLAEYLILQKRSR